MYGEIKTLSVYISETKHAIQLKFTINFSLFLMSTKSYLKFRTLRDTMYMYSPEVGGFGKPPYSCHTFVKLSLCKSVSCAPPLSQVVIAYVSYLCQQLLLLRRESRAALAIQQAWRDHRQRWRQRHQQVSGAR